MYHIPRIALPLCALLLAGCSSLGQQLGLSHADAPAAAPEAAPISEAVPLPPIPQRPIARPRPAAAHMPAPQAHPQIYAGEGKLLRHQPASCPVSLQLHEMQVRGKHAQLGDLQGVIKPNGTLDMAHNRISLVGHFHGGKFAGRYAGPHCAYQVALTLGGN